jgi:hypothetical protein
MNGNPLTMEEYNQKYPDQRSRVVNRSTLPNGKIVSTVLLGMDHAYKNERPLIFETMVFPNSDEFMEIDLAHYATKGEALEGHDRMCLRWMVGPKRRKMMENEDD